MAFKLRRTLLSSAVVAVSLSLTQITPSAFADVNAAATEPTTGDALLAAGKHIAVASLAGLGGVAAIVITPAASIASAGSLAVPGVIGATLGLSIAVTDAAVGISVAALAISGNPAMAVKLSQDSTSALATASSALTIMGGAATVYGAALGLSPSQLNQFTGAAANVDRAFFSGETVVSAFSNMGAFGLNFWNSTALATSAYQGMNAITDFAGLSAKPETENNSVENVPPTSKKPTTKKSPHKKAVGERGGERQDNSGGGSWGGGGGGGGGGGCVRSGANRSTCTFTGSQTIKPR